MKKLISLLLALVMVFSLATVAFAADDDPIDTSTWTTGDPQKISVKLYKVYQVIGANEDAKVLPDETLFFVAEADEGTPVITIDTIAPLGLTATEDEDDGNTYSAELEITLPTYTRVGTYEYEIKETAGTAQGATYSGAVIGATVLVTYNYNDSKLDAELILTTPAGDALNSGNVYREEEDDDEVIYKLDTFVNKYELGHLNVKKTVEGNLAARDVEFKMEVSLKSLKEVKSVITVVDGSSDTNGGTTSIELSDWTPVYVTNEADKTEELAYYKATATIYVRDGETVQLLNIPAGVTYTVVEDSTHKLADGAKVDPNSDTDKDYQVSGEQTTEKAISAGNTSSVEITNTKSTEVTTGITLDTLPFVLILAVCAGAVVLFVVKRRRSAEF